MGTLPRAREFVRTLFALTSHERQAALGALPFVIGVRVALWVLPSKVIVRRVQRMVESRPPAPTRRELPVATITWAVDAVSRRIPAASCLTQAIAAHIILRRHGHPSRLCVGVARGTAGHLRAHAWLEHDGRILIGGGGVRDLVRLPDIAGAAVGVKLGGRA